MMKAMAYSLGGLILSLLFLSCQKQENTKSFLNTLQIPLREQIETLDPANSYDTVSASVVYQAYEQLYEYHYLKRPYSLRPLLAKDFPKIDQKGTQYTIQIKKGILYHDDPAFKGRARYLKAIDFIHQIKRIALVKTRSKGWFLFKNAIKGLDQFRQKAKSYQDILNRDVEGLKAIGDDTLVIKLKKPYPQLRYVLAMSFSSPMPYEAIDYYQNDLRERLVGTGPFKLVKWNRGLNLRMEKNQKYHHGVYPSEGDSLAKGHGLLKDAGKQIPFIDKINFKIIKEDQTQWLNFLNEKIDFLAIPKDNFNTAITPEGKLSPELKGKDIVLEIMPTLVYWWLAFNMGDPILGKNLKLRQAMAHAINIKRYIQLFTNNVGQKANSIFIPGVAGYDLNSQVNFKFDLKKARLLMRQAGYPAGKGLPRFSFDLHGASTISRQKGEYIKSSLEKIGIKINVTLNTFPGFLKKLHEGKLQIWFGGWSLDYPDAENITQLLHSSNHPPGPNTSFYDNKQVDKLIEKLKALPDGPQKFSIMKEIEQNIFKDLPWILLYYKRDYLLSQGYLKNFRKSDLIYNYPKYLKIMK